MGGGCYFCRFWSRFSDDVKIKENHVFVKQKCSSSEDDEDEKRLIVILSTPTETMMAAGHVV